MNRLFQDVRYGIRMLVKNPGFTAVTVVVLALGISATAAIFSVVNAVLLRPLPYDDPARLMVLRENKLPQFPEFSVSPGNFLDWQSRNTTFDKLTAVSGSAFNLLIDSEPERLPGARISAGMLEMLGVKPAQGRTFLDEEDQAGHENVVILSDGLWRRRFSADPGIIGQAITLNAAGYTVIGIMPSAFQFPDRETALWTPIAFNARQAQQHGAHYISVIGRLRPGVTPDQANTDINSIAAQLSEQFPDSNTGWRANVFPMQEYDVRDIKASLLVLLGAVVLVLLISCANVANLLLARSTARQKEMGIRTALGASRWRVARQLLTESLLLALIGGGAGLLLARWGLASMLAIAPQDLPSIRNVTLDGRVLGVTLIVTLLTGLIFGLAPALQASSPDLNDTLKEGGRGTTGTHHRVRGVLVISEVAIAVLVLVVAGLLIRSFYRLQQVNPGFNPDKALAVGVSLPGRKYPQDDQQVGFFRQLIERVSTLPGVSAVGATQSLPIQGDYVLGFNIQGRPPDPPGAGFSTNYYAVSPDYFKAMGIRLLKGRTFTDLDNRDAPRVAVINEEMARRSFPDEDPIGKGINVTNGPERFREIVGIVADVKQYGLAQPSTMQTYEPYLQTPFSGMTLVVRTDGDLGTLSGAIRGEVLGIDKEQPLSRVRPLEQIVSESMARERFLMLLLGIFAAVALTLAAVGLYGVISYSVTQRAHEIGIRAALGAQRKDVLKLIVGQGMMLAAIGSVIGLGAAFAFTRVIETFLFGITATDPFTFVAIPVILIVVALGACSVPARRATKVDPIVALRYE